MEENKTQKIKWHKKTQKICQIPKEGLEFAMISSKNEQINQLVWCKDFMQDIIWAYLNKKKITIYGFSYDPDTDPAPCLNKVRLLIASFKDLEFENKINNNMLPFINAFEDKLKMKKTFIEKCSNPSRVYSKSGAFIVNGSCRWIKSPPMLSLYTLLIRIGLVHDPKNTIEKTMKDVIAKKISTYYDGAGRDSNMVKNAYAAIEALMKHTDKKIFPAKKEINYPGNICTDTIHNSFGIVGLSEKRTKSYMPIWHKIKF